MPDIKCFETYFVLYENVGISHVFFNFVFVVSHELYPTTSQLKIKKFNRN